MRPATYAVQTTTTTTTTTTTKKRRQERTASSRTRCGMECRCVRKAADEATGWHSAWQTKKKPKPKSTRRRGRSTMPLGEDVTVEVESPHVAVRYRSGWLHSE